MRVLVLEETADAARDAEAQLSSAGMDVVRCHQPDDPAFPCAGMPGGPGCPIETTVVDVALTMGRPADDAMPADGVRCALRHHIPVVASEVAEDAPWRSMVRPVDGDGVLGAVLAAADAPLRRHGQIATAALRDLLTRKGVDAPAATAVVERRTGGLAVELRPGVPVDTPVLQAAAVRVAAALRGIDHESQSVDVTVMPTTESAGAR